jgi:hypothetical protein
VTTSAGGGGEGMPLLAYTARLRTGKNQASGVVLWAWDGLLKQNLPLLHGIHAPLRI